MTGRSLHPPEPLLDDGVVMLRPFRESDVPSIVDACNDDAVQRFIPVPRPYGTAEAEAYLERTRRQWDESSAASFAIVEADDEDRLLGAINLRVFEAVGNCGYWVAPWARGRRVATRALKLVSTWGLGEVGLALVILEIREENTPSRHVAASAGFHQVGRIDINDVTLEKGGLIYTRSVSDALG